MDRHFVPQEERFWEKYAIIPFFLAVAGGMAAFLEGLSENNVTRESEQTPPLIEKGTVSEKNANNIKYISKER